MTTSTPVHPSIHPSIQPSRLWPKGSVLLHGIQVKNGTCSFNKSQKTNKKNAKRHRPISSSTLLSVVGTKKRGGASKREDLDVQRGYPRTRATQLATLSCWRYEMQQFISIFQSHSDWITGLQSSLLGKMEASNSSCCCRFEDYVRGSHKDGNWQRALKIIPDWIITQSGGV